MERHQNQMRYVAAFARCTKSMNRKIEVTGATQENEAIEA